MTGLGWSVRGLRDRWRQLSLAVAASVGDLFGRVMSRPWMRRSVGWVVGGAFGWLERLAGSWRGAVALFVVALADFVVQAVAWPLVAGKNLDEYLLTYVQLFDRHPLLPWAPLFRGPGAGVVIGPLLSLDGGGLAEPVAAVLFAVSIVAWSAAALWFGRRAAILTAFALLLYPGYGGLFHEFASEIVMATVFSLWALAVTMAAMRPSGARFALAGLGIAWLVLIRPGNAVLVPFALFPLLLAAPRRQRLSVGRCLRGCGLPAPGRLDTPERLALRRLHTRPRRQRRRPLLPHLRARQDRLTHQRASLTPPRRAFSSTCSPQPLQGVPRHSETGALVR